MALPTLGTSSGSLYSGGRRRKSSGLDLSNPETRQIIMQELGVSDEPKANLLQRLTGFLSAFETGNAVYAAMDKDSVGEGVKQYLSDIGGGLSGLITGKYDEDKKTYSDVLEKAGVDNKILRGVGGFIGDVALDPTTYVTFGASGARKVGGKELTKAGSELFEDGVTKASARIAAKAGGDLTETGMRKALTEFADDAAKEGIKLSIGNKNALEVAQEFAEKRLQKFATNTGAKFTKEAGEQFGKMGIKAGEDIFATPAMRFAGQEVFKLQDNFASKALKSYFDPIQVASEEIGKTGVGKAANAFISETVYPIRRLFSRKSELAGSRVIEQQYGELVNQMIKTADKMRYTNPQMQKTASQFVRDLMEVTDTPEAFPYVFERHSKDLIDKLPDEKLKQSIYQLADGIKKMAGTDNLVNSKGGVGSMDEVLKYRNQLVEWANQFDPVENMNKKLMASDENVGRFMDLVTKQQMLADERTALLKGAGILPENTSLDELGLSYLMRNVIETPGGQKTRLADDLRRFGTSSLKDNKKKRSFDLLAELELAGGKTTTTGKKGREAAEAIANNIGRTEGLVAQAMHWKELENTLEGMTDSFGERVARDASEIGDKLIKAGDYRQVTSSLTGEKLFGGKYVPKDVANILNKTHKTFFNDEATNELLKKYDKITNFWKRSVTAFFPAFHIRNGFSNVVANVMEGVTNPTRYSDAKIIQDYANTIIEHGVDSEQAAKLASKKIGKTGMAVKDLLDIAEKNGIIDSGTFWDEVAEGGWKKTQSKLNKMINQPTRFGNFIEDNAKIAHLIDKMDKGYGISDAVASVKKTLFDYGDLTDFEKNVMRRVIPFYTWARKNAELQLRTIAKQPGLYGAQLKLLRDAENAFSDLSDEELQNLPPWVRNGVNIYKGENGQATAYFGFGLPVEAFSDFMGSIPGLGLGSPEDTDILASANPLLRIPLEQTFDKALFSKRVLSKDTSGKNFRYAVKMLPKAAQDALGYKEVEKETRTGEKYTEYLINPNAKFWLNALASRFISTSERVGRFAEGDQGAGIDLFTGVKTYQFDLAEEEERRQMEAERALYDELISRGLAKEFTRPYVTDEGKKELAQVE